MSTQKNTKAFLLFIALITLTPFTAQAQEEPKIRWHIGIDAMSTSISYNTIGTINYNDVYASELNGYGLRFGFRGSHLGLEIGSYATNEAQKNNIFGGTTSSKIKLQNVTWDILGFFPLDEEGRAEIIGSIGFAQSTSETELKVTNRAPIVIKEPAIRESEIKARLGVGFKYGFNKNLALRTMIHWQDANSTNVAKRSYIFTLGLNYTF